MVPFGLQGASSLLMRVMNQAVTLGFRLPPFVGAGPLPPQPGLEPVKAGAPLFIWTIAWCTRRRLSSTCST